MPTMRYKLAKIFAGLCFLGVALLLSLFPFVVSETMIEPTQTPKTFVFLYGGIAIGSVFLLSVLWRKNERPLRITAIDIVAGTLLLYILTNRYLLQDTVGFSFRFYELLGMVLIYTIIRLTVPKYIYWFLLALITGGLLQALYGNLQLYEFSSSWHSDFKLTGSFFNPGPYAGYLVSVFPAALGIWLFRDRIDFGRSRPDSDEEIKILTRKKLLVYTAFMAGVVVFLVLPASQSRAAMLAAAVSSCYLVFYWFGGKKLLFTLLNTPVKKVIAFVLAGFIMAGSMGAAYWIKKDSADGRILIWKVTVQMILEQSVTGLGFDRFRAGYMDAQAAYFQRNLDEPSAELATDNHYAFNELLQFTAEQGVIGLALLLLLGILIIRTSDKANSIWLIISKAGILSVVVFAFFSYPSQILSIKLNLVLFLAIIASYGKLLPLQFSLPRWLNPWFKGAVSVLLLGTSVWGVLHLNELRSASKTWKLGVDVYNSGNFEQALFAYEDAYSIFNREGDFLTNYGKALSMAGRHQQAVKILNEAKKHVNNTIIQTALGDSYKALDKFEEAEAAYILASDMLPERFFPKYLLAVFYEETNRPKHAIPIARELLYKDPKISSTAVNEIKQEMERILLTYDESFSDRSTERYTDDDIDFKKLPVEINRRVVISEKCDMIVYSSNRYHAFNPSLIQGVFRGEGVIRYDLLDQEDDDFYPYSISNDCTMLSLVSENQQAGKYVIHLYNMENDEMFLLPQQESSDNGFPLFSPQGSVLAWLSDGTLNLFDYESQESLEIVQHDAFQNVVWSPDGKRLYMQSHSGDIWGYLVSENLFERLWSTSAPFYTDRMILPSSANDDSFYFLSDHESNVNQIYKYTGGGNAELVVKSSYDKYLLRYPVNHDRIYYRENINGNILLRKKQDGESFATGPEKGVVYGAWPIQDGFIMAYAGINEPASIFRWRNDKGEDLLIQPVQEPILSPQKLVNENGMVHLLYIPDSGTVKSWVLWLHGGPHEQMSVRYHVYINNLVREGYGVIALNYPGSTGIGREYEMRGHPFSELVRFQIETITQDIDHILNSQLNKAVDQLYVIGVSYGAVLAHLLSQQDEINISKLVDFSGLYSAADHIAEIPKLYIYGAYDYALDDVNRKKLIQLERQRTGNQQVVIEDEGHVIHRSRNIQQILQEILIFFNADES